MSYVQRAVLLGCSWEDLDPVYFGLNHYGWFTHMYDKKTGEDLLPKIREIVKEKGFLPQDAEQRDQSLVGIRTVFVQTMFEDFPDYLPNTYDGYYLYPDYKVSHLNPNYTRADDSRALRVPMKSSTDVKHVYSKSVKRSSRKVSWVISSMQFPMHMQK